MLQRIHRLLVANRGEIAIRVMRAANELDIETVAIYSQEDRFGLHRTKADEAYLVGEGKGAIEAYLDIRDILRVAREARVDAIHPGYGFLAENPDFAEGCAAAGLVFIGPSPDTMRVLGNKVAARNLAASAGVAGHARHAAAAGGSGRMRAAGAACRLSGHAEGQLGRRRPRHARHRERCSSLPSCCRWRGARPRRPSATTRSISRSWCAARATLRCRSSATATAISCTCSSATARCSGAIRRSWNARPRCSSAANERAALCEAALAIGRAANYCNAGTVEFLQDADSGDFYFIEVNPRIQVEHTVTECATGIDLVKAQIRIADGARIGEPASGVPAQAQIRHPCRTRCNAA